MNKYVAIENNREREIASAALHEAVQHCVANKASLYWVNGLGYHPLVDQGELTSLGEYERNRVWFDNS